MNEMKGEKGKNMRNKGITLIALVITIIVLLILAGVTIATLTGDNGILAQANEAKEKNEVAKEEELRKLTAIEAATYIEEHEYEDPSGETITIPAQCAVSQVEGENTLEDGLVIIDKNGNEWVWIEVPESVTASSTTDEEIKNALISYVTNYRGSYLDSWTDGCGLEESEYVDNYSKMLQSIKLNGGFYIGKYEVGSFDNPVMSNDNSRKPVIQKGAYPYNHVECWQAEELAEKLAIEGKTSTLLFGIQWDLVLKYIEVKAGLTYEDLTKDSSSWGNYRNVEFTVMQENRYAIYTNFVLNEWNSVQKNFIKQSFNSDGNGILLSTGATKRNSKMNIYDLAGNLWEWTLEKSDVLANPYTCRGGIYDAIGSRLPASSRLGTTAGDVRIGFRSALY